MKRYYLIMILLMSFDCCAMVPFFNREVPLVIKKITSVFAENTPENKLLQKPAISPLPNFSAEILHQICLYLHSNDDEALSHFACTCQSINNKLNSVGPHIFIYPDYKRLFLPLKIIKDCVQYNRKLIEQCIQVKPEELKDAVFLSLFQNVWFNREYIAISHLYADDIISRSAFLQNLSYKARRRFGRKWQNEHKIENQWDHEDRWIADNMLSLCCAQTPDPACIRFLLNQKVPIEPLDVQINSNYIQTTPPIEATINALVKKGGCVFDRCIKIMDLLVEHNADVHYISPYFEWNYLHRSVAHNATVLLPYFIGKGVNPNEQDKKGETPLFLVAKSIKDLYWKGRPRHELHDFDVQIHNACLAIEHLMQGGANPDIVNNKNKSMFDYIPELFQAEFRNIINKYKKEE